MLTAVAEAKHFSSVWMQMLQRGSESLKPPHPYHVGHRTLNRLSKSCPPTTSDQLTGTDYSLPLCVWE